MSSAQFNRRVRAIAKEIRTNWGINARQATEIAKQDVAAWAATFSAAGLRAQRKG